MRHRIFANTAVAVRRVGARAAAMGSAQLAALQRRADGSPVAARLAALQVAAGGKGPAQRAAEEEELQMVQRAAVEEEPETEAEDLQMVQRVEAAATPQPAAAGGGLPGPLKSGIEALSGMAMDDVRVHRNSAEPAQVGAHAFAQGRDIHLAAGQERHLPHEAWHVVQQQQGRVAPTTEAAGVPINDDRGLETEADAMGAKALSTAAQEPRSRA